jgi:hypothetical protein
MIKILLAYVLPLALMIYAIVDCAADDEVERTSVPKAAWILMIVILPYFGPIAWLAVSRIARPKVGGSRKYPGGGGSSNWPGRRPNRPGPVAPDDNPDFLRRLAEERERKERERRRQERENKPDQDPPENP